MTGTRIIGWGTSLPQQRLTNAELAERVDTSDAWIVEKSGIHERRVAAVGETTATFATEAAARAIADAGIAPTDVDLLILATVSPDTPMPHTGAYVGDRLGLRCGSLDVNVACSGFVYSLVLGAGMLRNGLQTVLIVGAETMTRITDPTHRGTCVLFGDGAGAAVLRATDDADDWLLAFDLGCDGSAADILAIPAGGSRRPASAETVAARDHFIHMQGRAVFDFAVKAVVQSCTATLERAGVHASDVRWLVPHQANLRIIEAAAAELGIPMDRAVVTIDHHGNTSAASIPLALGEALAEHRVGAGDLVLMIGFGAGMAWASALVRWGSDDVGRRA